MPVYQIDIEKGFSPTTGTTVFWTNVYHVNVTDVAAAIAAGQQIVALERLISTVGVAFTKLRARLYNVLSQAGTVVPLTGNGNRTSSDNLPLFNVFRIDIAVASGRPNRKYFRGPVLEADQASGAIVSSTATLIQNSYITPLVNLAFVVDTQGQAITSGVVHPYVGMRQLRRGSKRKTTPVI